MKHGAKVIMALIVLSILVISGCSSAIKREQKEPRAIGWTEYSTVHPIANIGLGLAYSNPDIKINSIPETFRDVPIHNNDTYVPSANAGPITQNSVSLPRLLEIPFVQLGLGYNTGNDNRIRIIGDVLVNLSHFGELEEYGKDGDIFDSVLDGIIKNPDPHLRNYTNAVGTSQRDVGAALTYLTGKYADGIHLGYSIENMYDISKNSRKVWGIGWRKYGVAIETGWDRFNSYEKYQQLNVANINEIEIYHTIYSESGKNNREYWFFKIGLKKIASEIVMQDVEVQHQNSLFFLQFGAKGGAL